jgi:hypothetical protein
MAYLEMFRNYYLFRPNYNIISLDFPGTILKLCPMRAPSALACSIAVSGTMDSYLFVVSNVSGYPFSLCISVDTKP